jgi:sulfur dioxygenase
MTTRRCCLGALPRPNADLQQALDARTRSIDRLPSIGQEKARNPRLGKQRTLAEFEQFMADLKLPYPKFIDYAAPGNRLCGVCPEDLPQQMQAYCQRMSDSPQG